jgi:dTDP-4-dehydrorhamnose reductase
MKRVLITGAAGLLGQHLMRRLMKSHSILAIDIAENPFESHENVLYLRQDLTELGKIKPAIDDFAPELIFNCAGMTDVDECEIKRELTYRINVGIVENLSQTKFGKIIHISSDYVFNGENGPYGETDPTDPLGWYGQTKLQSEKLLSGSDRKHIIIRTNVLFGTGQDIRPNFITWLIDNLKQGQHLQVVTDQFNNPIHAGNFAEAAMEIAAGDFTGIIHIAGSDYLSRYEIAVETAAYFGFDPELIEPITSDQLRQPARRPLKGGLKIARAQRLLKTRLLRFQEGLSLLPIKRG